MAKYHKIVKVEEDSIGSELGIEPGDLLISINNQEIEDIFDYRYLINDEYITVLIRKPDGEEWELEIEKEFEEDLGIDFEESLMDCYKSCKNKCIFCFIDQMPPGMRETLYFKDDDARLSFLQGNYITLTNMKDKDLDRIINYKLEPINISVHTTNPELRCKMLNNRFAGNIMDRLTKIYEGEIHMNSQIVCCKGWNDGKELDRTIEDLSMYVPYMQSLSVVPMGQTKFREGLAQVEMFNKEDCLQVIRQIEGWQAKFLKQFGTRFVYASDEWYIQAGLEVPEEDNYEGYMQLENGVGMVRLLQQEVSDYLETLEGDDRVRKVSIATGELATGVIKKQVEKVQDKFPNVEVNVYTIINDFFGHDITVAGLLTGQDIIRQLKDKDLGDKLILPSVLLRDGENILLDDYDIDEISKQLGIEVLISDSESGESFVESIIRRKTNE